MRKKPHQDEVDPIKEVARKNEEIKSLTDISVALSREKDREKLFHEILTRVRHLTHSDGGALFVVVDAEPTKNLSENSDKDIRDKKLIFKIVQNDSVPAIERDFKEMTVDVNEQSLVGYCAIHQKVINIDDAYHLKADAPYQHDSSWDQRHNYRTRSILAVPMIGTKGNTLGVIELINRKVEKEHTLGSVFSTGSHVLSFDEGTESFAMALAGQAAIALENINLYSDIERLFEGFIHASVKAIEDRDPTTSGHSFRVCELTLALTQAVNEVSVGPYKNVQFNSQSFKEIEYACLLHDFGKIAIPSEVLVKAKKLYPQDLQFVLQRIEWLKAEVKLLASHKKIERVKNQQTYDDIDKQLQESLVEIEHMKDLIVKSNEPTVLEEGDFRELESFKQQILVTENQQEIPYLTDTEFECLSLPRGTLTSTERKQIENHVTNTFSFLKTIPWTQDLKNVSEIAYSHHEKLNGNGYPRGLKAEAIPVQSRMMTIADIFDALTARDRPYKKAVPVEKSLSILKSEVDRGDLDGELFQIFLDRKVYKVIENKISH